MSDAGVMTMRWRRSGMARRLTSSGITKSRPETAACARAEAAHGGPQCFRGLFDLALCEFEPGVSRRCLAFQLGPRQSQLDGRVRQMLLGAVMEFSFDALALRFKRGHKSGIAFGEPAHLPLERVHPEHRPGKQNL